MNNLFLNNIINFNHIRSFLGIITFLILLLISCSATAASTSMDDPTGIITIFCNVIEQITGGIGKVIAILILISMAIGLFLGKITWGVVIAVMVGMGLLFGAPAVVDTIAGKDNNTGVVCPAAAT